MNVPQEPPARPDGRGQPPSAPPPVGAGEPAPPWTESAAPQPAAVSGRPPEPSAHRRPWAWIAACGVLLVVAAGFAIWALNLNSDLDHQRDETAAAQQQTEAVAKQVDDISNELDQAGENAQGVLADIKAKLAALVQKIKEDTGSGSTDGSGGTGAATATATAADTAAQSAAQGSATATP